ncbi:MAG: amino acid permease [Sedimentisphaerales bacterium]|nr:amino acid permease [Sedimentisphaerales bacterium]
MRLAKELGLLHIFSIASGAMISSGLFILPGLAHARAGPAVILSYSLAGLLAMGGLLSIAELTTAMPKAGADYFYISRAMGPAMGTAAGILSWFSLSLKSAFALVGLAVLVAPFIPLNEYFIGALLCLVFVLINLAGAREAARFQVVLVIGLLALMLYFIVRGLPAVNVRHFEPFAPYGLKAVFSTTGFVFVSYGGLMNVASVAGEVKKPGRLIPLGMVLALSSIIIVYTLMILVTSGVLGPEQLDDSLTPISDAAAVFSGPAGRVAISVAAALAFLTTANAGIMTASRYLFALGRDQLLPQSLSRVGTRFQTPHISIIVTGIVISVALFVKLDILVEAASTVFVLGYILASLSVIVLRESGLQNYRPSFRTPLYPWVQLATILGLSFVVLEMGEHAFLITALVIVLAFSLYWFYGRRKTQQASALMHLVSRIMAKELIDGTLESELKAIVRERDEIALDRFDSLVESSIVLDLDRKMELEEFFRLAAGKLGPRVGIDPDALLQLLRDREKDTSTVLSPVLAVPHVVIEGTDKFDMLLARCRKGVRFSEKAPEIRTLFVIAGSRDQRNFYLRVLSAIAQIVQNGDFEAKWRSARNEQALRDVVLLSQRKRTL